MQQIYIGPGLSFWNWELRPGLVKQKFRDQRLESFNSWDNLNGFILLLITTLRGAA